MSKSNSYGSYLVLILMTTWYIAEFILCTRPEEKDRENDYAHKYRDKMEDPSPSQLLGDKSTDDRTKNLTLMSAYQCAIGGA